MQFALLLLSVAGYIGVPIVLIVGWRRWLRRSSPQGRLSVLSLTGFALGSSSALLAGSSVLYAMVVREFRYYDPTLLVIYKVGIYFHWEAWLLRSAAFGAVAHRAGMLLFCRSACCFSG